MKSIKDKNRGRHARLAEAKVENTVVGIEKEQGIKKGPVVQAWQAAIYVFGILTVSYFSLIDSRVAAIVGVGLAVFGLVGLLSPKTPLASKIYSILPDSLIEAYHWAVVSRLTLYLLMAVAVALVFLCALIDFVALLRIAVMFAAIALADRLIRGLVRGVLGVIAVCFVALIGLWALSFLVAGSGAVERAYQKVRSELPEVDLAFSDTPSFRAYSDLYKALYDLNFAIEVGLGSCASSEGSPDCMAIRQLATGIADREMEGEVYRSWKVFSRVANRTTEERTLASIRQNTEGHERAHFFAAGTAFVARPFTKSIAILSTAAKVGVYSLSLRMANLSASAALLSIIVCLGGLGVSRGLVAHSRRFDPTWQPEGHVLMTYMFVLGAMMAIFALVQAPW